MAVMLEQARIAGDDFPYDSKRVAYFTIYDGEIRAVPRFTEARRSALLAARAGEITLYAVWPGEWRSDLFVIPKGD